MAKKVYNTTLNASTIDILNVIRENAGLEYQQQVPAVNDLVDIPKVGDILYGYPALANTFLSSLMNRIALVLIKNSMYNDPYKMFKKGEVDYGETIEEVFIDLAKAREFNIEKTNEREYQRTLAQVRTAFHVINLRIQYPITIQDVDLRQAFVSAEGVTDMIEKIIASVYNAWEYDEFLIFKYLMIKAIANGKMKPVAFDSTDMKKAGKAFRGTSNKLEFMSTENNIAGVHTTTLKDDQYIFMDSDFNAAYDIEVLASSFNMDRAIFMGHLKLVDSWTEFDNERFSAIQAGSDQLPPITSEELAIMANVKAVLVDREWFQFYDNVTKFTETYAGSGMYTNFWLNKWCTVSSSPFSNAIVFVDDGATVTDPSTLTLKVTGKDSSAEAVVLTIENLKTQPGLTGGNINFRQTSEATTLGVAVSKVGAIVIPVDVITASSFAMDVEVETPAGTVYKASDAIDATTKVGDTITVNKQS